MIINSKVARLNSKRKPPTHKTTGSTKRFRKSDEKSTAKSLFIPQQSNSVTRESADEMCVAEILLSLTDQVEDPQAAPSLRTDCDTANDGEPVTCSTQSHVIIYRRNTKKIFL